MTIDEKIATLEQENKEKEARKQKLAEEARSIVANENAADDEIKKADESAQEVRSLNEQINKNLQKIENYRALQIKPKKDGPKLDTTNSRKLDTGGDELRSALNDYIHSRGYHVAAELRDGLTSPDASVTIPESIAYNPENEVKTVTDLSKLVQHFKATTPTGKYPILKRATAGLSSVAELAKNPDLAKPEFLEVSWEVQTYRGAIPLSNEAIADSAIDLLGLVSRNALEQKINTTNAAISEKIKGFTPKTVAGDNVDDLKHIINVDLDPAYSKTIIASQSFYNWLDTLKDKDGRYLLQQPIVDDSPVRVLGIPIHVVEDDLLGAAGEAHAFIGDIQRAVVMADRLDIQVRWVDNEIFGQYLQAATRFDVEIADSNAGYFVSATAAAPSTQSTVKSAKA